MNHFQQIICLLSVILVVYFGFANGDKQCYVCRSYAEGEFYPHCPKDGDVNPQITWKENCTGHCFTRTDDLDDKLVYRGCSDSQWGLPDPLPPDGCYTYYLEVWCICNKNLCNGIAIGEGEIEFDAHIPKEIVSREFSISNSILCKPPVNFDEESI
ncbi:hypothetical protein LOTGIDRAFT_169054 [Lottia gigantea]|uniref:Protein quiver n=1 Tax=Lottia gigantea TaxID=225164 RepID=V4B5L7_LOTGI|nr:hypothetical protein LOTGIDRAFT_169054 [Lottia gigantea]ESO83819.1 hypothetical protein LOTGIDRAFT_169054 [Lottia gigantea]